MSVVSLRIPRARLLPLQKFCTFCAGLLLVGVSAAAENLEAEARELEAKLMSPCCMTNTVAVHESGASAEMRREIREMLAAGQSEREILDHYVERYGPQILAMPEARGFSLVPYLFPLVFVILAGGALAVAVRRWRAAVPTEVPPTEPPLPSGSYAERLKQELEKLE
jgi:cytochrome c-type biogenesis protein CcmH/NrfF